MVQVSMKIINTLESQVKPSVVMLVYGEGGVGKTTFASSAPKPILADCEGGTKYFGLRGIGIDVAVIESWNDMNFKDGFGTIIKGDKYETVVIDPIGDLMDKLKRYMNTLNDSKLVQKDGSPTMAGWGWLKKTLRDYIKVIRDCGKHVIIIAHLDEQKDEDRIVKRPKVETKLSDEIVNMVDVVGYMTVEQDQDGISKRVIIVDPGNDRYTAKDRTGMLGKKIEPDFSKIVKACQGTETFVWSRPKKSDEKAMLPQTEKVTVTKSKLAMANER